MRSSGLQAKHKGEMMNKCPAGDQETVEQPSIYDPAGLHVNFLARQAKEWREKMEKIQFNSCKTIFVSQIC